MSFIYEGFLAKVSKSGSFLTHLFTESLFSAIFFKNQGHFWRRDTEPGLLNDPPDDYYIIPSTCYPFHLLFFCPIVFFNTRDNGSTGHRTWDHRFEWSIMTTCHLPTGTCYLWHLCTCCDVKNRWWHKGRYLASRSNYWHDVHVDECILARPRTVSTWPIT